MLEKLKKYINEIYTYKNSGNILNNKISAANISWHIEHILLTTTKVINALSHSDATLFTQKFNLKRTIFLFAKTIPRGKAKAPKTVLPVGVTEEELNTLYNKVTEKLVVLENSLPNQYFAHPFLGNLNKKQTIQFLCIHTKHHLKIIKDILK